MNENKELSRYDLLEIGYAIKSLADAFTSRDADEAICRVQSAARNLATFLGAQQPVEKLNEDEASWSRELHTWLRKFDDSHVSCILYRMIAENAADAVWHAFIRELAKSRNLHNALQAAKETADKGPTEWMIFEQALFIWEETGGLKPAAKEIAKQIPRKPAAALNEQPA